MADITRGQVVIAQLAAAFGQGAGTLFVSEAAVAAALAHFSPVVPRMLEQWSEAGLQTLEYARTVGRTAGFLAAERGSGTISDQDFTTALARVRGTQQQLAPCPFIHGPGTSQ